MPPIRQPLLLVFTLLMISGCASGGSEQSVRRIDAPGNEGSGRPHLFAADDGGIYMSWTEPDGDSLHALRYAVYEEGRWSEVKTVARGRDWFVNWADFPSLIAQDEQSLSAHFLVKSGPSPYAYDVHVTRSEDGGRSWSNPLVPHSDGTQTEHGFVSLLSGAGGPTGLVWLDGRETGGEAGHGGHEGAMTLRYAELGANGAIHRENVLDTRVCDCCQTAAVADGEELLVFYRDRSEEEVRDIAYVRYREGVWSEPAVVAADRWEIHGCPVNGPSADARNGVVAVAWFTAAHDSPRVQVAFSSNDRFNGPVLVSDSAPLGRVDVVLLDDGSALVSWMESREGAAEIRYRRVGPDGTVHPPRTVASIDDTRSSGFPRMARQGDEVLFAWTDVGPPTRLRTAVVALR